MPFDPNPHHLRMIVIRCGRLLFPSEKNITTLYEKTAPLLGIVPFNTSTTSINWEPASQLVRQILVAAGEKIRDLQGLPPEENMEKLAHDTAKDIGMTDLNSNKADESALNTGTGVSRFPAPHEMKNEAGKFMVPRKDCPSCGQKESMILGPLCRSCRDAEGGKFKAMWRCEGCGLKDKSEKPFVKILDELGVDFGSGTKESMGIKTYTDEGVR